ncbi:integrin-linked kinase-associated serine/threonine phosphatase 2C isoform X4 [Xiphophorus couchianus]|uniref:integrin-linked kinase-associated serine/threonine phosphatase 2C isoform X4 n=1 Tax=Xiphophorus couchianus TaxID=32473 RepID=UPI001016ECF3|nr:integrin-linked kinase-associated serine/threonine phosphatase 2C isoform X4 [Xiphophorus couchianus]
MDLFDDLPEPTQTSVAPPAQDEEDRRFKRRRDDEEEEEEEEDEIKKVCREGLPRLRGYAAARRGEREEMQDAHVLMPDMSSCLSSLPGHVSRVSYFAVFDGHGGARASRFAAENLHLNLAKKFPSGDAENLDKLLKKCLLDTFRQTDEDFLKKASSQKPAWKDGSTATCILVVDDTVYSANLGDSRAVLCRTEAAADGQRKSVTLALSKEHNPTIYEERMRIQRAGGTVRFILLACDGLFKVFSADEAVKFVLSVLQETSVEQKDELTEEELRFEAACQQLASEAVRRGCADNVTVILVSVCH